jgi:type IV pilus assembly protein PilC
MPFYSFLAMDEMGNDITGVENANDEMELVRKLQERNLVVVSIEPVDGPGRDATELAERKGVEFGQYVSRAVADLWARLNRVKIQEIVIFSTQIAAMIRGGIPVLRALIALSREIGNKKMRKILLDVIDRITRGSSFADALAEHPEAFSNFYVSMVRSAEASGQLDNVLAQLARYMETMHSIRSRIKGAMIYPAMIVAIASIGWTVLMVKVVPMFQKIYGAYHAQLPSITRMVIGFSEFIRRNALNWTLIGLALAAGIFLASKTKRGRHIIDTIKLKIPVVGEIIRKTILMRYARTLSMLHQSGVPTLQAFEITAGLLGNSVYERALRRMAEGIALGRNISDMMREVGVFPEMLVQMTETGEASGLLDYMLSRAADFYEEGIERGVKTIISLMEPVMIVFLAGAIGFAVLSMFLPVFKLGMIMR